MDEREESQIRTLVWPILAFGPILYLIALGLALRDEWMWLCVECAFGAIVVWLVIKLLNRKPKRPPDAP